MMKIRMFTMPNMLTLCNLLCGCAALVFCLRRGDLHMVFWLVVAAAVFDFLDGFAARLTGSYSELGKQLDSLADMVSFGVVPAAVLFSVFVWSGGNDYGLYFGIVTASVALFSALRLAKFNIDERQGLEFIGLPTPACALFVVSAGWMFAQGSLAVHPLAVLGVSLVLSYLLVSPLRMFALKFRNWSWSDNKVRYIFILGSVVALALFRISAIPFIILSYVVISLILAAVCRGGRKAVTGDINKID